MPFVRQHLIDPLSCVRCDSCRFVCTNKAITKIDGTLAIDFDLCDGAGACIGACDTGAIQSWRVVESGAVYATEEQAMWFELPPQQDFGDDAVSPQDPAVPCAGACAPATAQRPQVGKFRDSAPAQARVVANVMLTPGGTSEIHHVVIDLTDSGMIVAEGQSVGILPPGTDDQGRPHEARLYSVASARCGEAGQQHHVAFTIKRVVSVIDGQVYPGVCSNHVCDLRPGDPVRLTGPYGASFLLPEDPQAQFLFICTGTGIAPMRGMIEWWMRSGWATADRLMLVYGARTVRDLAYHDELALAAERGDIGLELALSRDPGKARRYVQDALAERRDRIARHLASPNAYVYLCGLVSMEAGVFDAFAAICAAAGLDWPAIEVAMRAEGRLHMETY
ncbi:hypothetical protein AQZ50_19350 [Novosphingobium sp. Fuku2-ISO-50]|nr:hypothetical protein AQZ50_19350 [Novosphingobium sp. Fuku2-ISO-50]